MKYRSQLALLLSLFLVLASCGAPNTSMTDGADTGSDPAAGTVTDNVLTPKLPDTKFEGETITIFQRNEDRYLSDFYVEENQADTMSDAVYKRNSRIAEQFGIEFELILSADKSGGGAEDTILAGDDTYDLLVPHARHAFRYIGQGLALDWNELEWIDLDKPWWSNDARDAFTFSGKLYTMIGDISYMNLADTHVILFNKALFDKNSLQYPYQDVLDGVWTFDKFAELAKNAAYDINGDNKIDIENDQMGFTTQHWNAPITILYTADQRICRKDENQEMYLSLNTEKTIDVFDKFLSFVKEPGIYCQLANGYDALNQAFTEGRVMFTDMNVGDTMNLRDMKDDFGIIPWPKFDESVDKYYTNVDAGCNLIIVPITQTNTECISAVVEALAYDSYVNVLPTYYDVVLQTKYTRDEESPLMLDIIREGRVYDIGYFYDNAALTYEINSIGRFLVHEPSPNFSTFYAQYESMALASIEAINAYYRGLE